MKKAISYMACSMAAMLALSACGSAASSASTVASSSDAASTESTAASEASNEPVTITFAQYSGSGDNEQYLQQMVDNYMKENPNVTIDLQTYGYDDYFTQMTAKVSGGQAPDVFELDYQNFVSYAKKGALMPLDDILTKDSIDTSIYNDMALKAFSADGVQYGVPDSFSNVVLIYNKDLFESGRLGMIVTGIWAFPEYTSNCDFDWDIVVEPGHTQKATHFFSNGYVVSKDSQVADEAVKFITYISSNREATQIRLDAGWELPPVQDEDIIAQYKEKTPPANREAVFKSLDYLVTPPVITQYAELQDIVGQHLSAAAAGTVTPEQALKDMQAECEQKIDLTK